ncbi:hypothetical protein M3Y96_01166700 [Aphelenchoides besseyi]|nr:hypothetical protein M3Y96_01166700 [Aphelenchoides besseyi]
MSKLTLTDKMLSEYFKISKYENGDCKLAIEDEEPTVRKPLHMLHSVLQLTLLMYRTGPRWQVSLVRLIIAIIVFSIISYQTGYYLYILLSYSSSYKASGVTIFCWIFQGFLAACFLNYWQYTGQLQLLMSEIAWHKFEFFHNWKYAKRQLYRYYGVFGLIAILSLCYMSLSFFLYYTDHPFGFYKLLPELYWAYPCKHSFAITSIVFTYGILTWIAVLMFYICISLIVYNEFELLNQKLQKVGNRGESRAKVAENLLNLYDRQVTLASIVRQINSTFEVYTFLMIAVEATTFGNRHLYLPYDSQVYEISNMFIAHSKQSDLGISVWGFALISKSIILTCFIVYWQRRNVLRQLAQVVPWENVAMSEKSGLKNRVCKAFLVFSGFFITCVLSLIFSAVIEYFYGSAPHYDLKLTDAYGNARFRFVFYVVTFYAMTVWLTSMSLYVVVSITVHEELEKFNETLKDIGEDRTRDEVADQLLDRYSKHVELSEIVRSVDNAFEVYNFAMLGTNIPTSVFTLLSFYRALNTGQWYDIALSCPELMFCIVQIVGLTIQPARVYGAIRQIESIIYGNQRIWMPYNASVYQIANVFVSHANQQGLGISIWGFAVVTKPMILTTTSLVLTYLTLLIQMNGSNQECENVLAIMNHTA